MAAAGRATFLGEVARTLYAKYGEDIASLSLLFPSRRARLFFADELSHIADKPLWEPEWLSLDRLMEELSGLHAGDRLRLIAELYRVYRRYHEEDFDRFDMIVAMDDMNYESLNRLAPSREAARKIFRMAEFCRRHPDRTYVPDPYYEGHEGFELVLDMLEDGCEGILEYLSENGK